MTRVYFLLHNKKKKKIVFIARKNKLSNTKFFSMQYSLKELQEYKFLSNSKLLYCFMDSIKALHWQK